MEILLKLLNVEYLIVAPVFMLLVLIYLITDYDEPVFLITKLFSLFGLLCLALTLVMIGVFSIWK